MFPSPRLVRVAFVCLVALVVSACPPGPGPTDTDAPDADAGPGVSIGTHSQWKQQPDDFIALHDDSELPIVLGHQGLWMVVLAVRSFETLEGELDLVARIEAANVIDEMMLINRPLDRELDGADYLYDIWLVVSDPSLASYQATVTLELTDSNGLEVVLERSVLLTGGSL